MKVISLMCFGGLFCLLLVWLCTKEATQSDKLNIHPPKVQSSCHAKDRHNLLVPPVWKTMDDVGKKHLISVYGELKRAYLERDAETFSKWLPVLPEQVATVPGDVLDEIERPLLEAVMGEWVLRGGAPLQEFSDAVTARHFMAVGLAGVRMIGDTRMSRRKYGPGFDDIEAYVFRRLKKYREKYKELGRPDLVQVFNDFINEWIRHIESEQGYTRTCVARNLEMSRINGREIMLEFNQTWRQIVQNGIQQGVFALVDEGYTPLWLAEFENIPEPYWESVDRQ